MTVDRHSVTAIVRPIDLQLNVKDLRVTLDEGWSPYCLVELTGALPASADRNAFDLRTGQLELDLRLRRDFGNPWQLAMLTADLGGSLSALTAEVGGSIAGVTNRYYQPFVGSVLRDSQTRQLTLYVTERTFDDETREVFVKASSFEALLLNDALIDDEAWSPGSLQLSEICAGILDRYDRTLIVEQDAIVAEVDATLWRPGVTASAYLRPMLEAASLRLWCDERGTFRLGPRQSAVDGSVNIATTVSMTGHRDTMAYDPDQWFEAVVIEYQWTDELGATQIAYDYAGPQPSRSTLTLERTNTAYPGPGAAAGILDRAQGRGRLLQVEAVSDYTVTPGMAASIAPPDTDTQTGYVASVTWRLPAAEMSVGTRGLVDTPADAFIFGPDDVTFATVAVDAPNLALNDFDWSLV